VSGCIIKYQSLCEQKTGYVIKRQSLWIKKRLLLYAVIVERFCVALLIPAFEIFHGLFDVLSIFLYFLQTTNQLEVARIHRSTGQLTIFLRLSIVDRKFTLPWDGLICRPFLFEFCDIWYSPHKRASIDVWLSFRGVTFASMTTMQRIFCFNKYLKLII